MPVSQLNLWISICCCCASFPIEFVDFNFFGCHWDWLWYYTSGGSILWISDLVIDLESRNRRVESNNQIKGWRPQRKPCAKFSKGKAITIAVGEFQPLQRVVSTFCACYCGIKSFRLVILTGVVIYKKWVNLNIWTWSLTLSVKIVYCWGGVK